LLLNKIVFLDRDGVINQDSPDYIKSWDEFTFISRSLEAIRELTSHGFTVFVITNQSIIGRRMVTREELLQIHERMKESIAAAGGSVQDIFFCPHMPDDNCNCRKPKPGLIQQAQGKYQLDLNKATMVGDNAKDILCAQAAGCRHAILVRTGCGDVAQKTLSEKNIAFDYLANDLYDAVEWILKMNQNHPVLPSGQAEKQAP
jgi:D-glycero-D-manno-heptose 1,7-bisphosphate phosphatase